MGKERLWTKDFVTIFLINFLVYLTYFVLMVIIASYAVDRFHASTSTAGLVAGIFVIGVLIGRLGTGRIIEDKGSRRILIAGTACFIVTSALYFAAINLPLLVIIRLFHGIAYGMASTAAGTIVAQIIPGSRHGEGIGFYSLSAILATALGPFIGIILSQLVDFKMIFVVTLILAAVSFVISFTVGEPLRGSPTQDGTKAVKRFDIANYLEFAAVPISIIALIIGFAYSVVLAFISLYTRQIHLEEPAGFFFLIFSIAILASRPFSGRLFDLKGANFVVYPCLIIFAGGMLLFSQVGHGFALLAAGAIIGLGYGNFLSCGQAISIKVVPPQRMGLATATYFIFLDLGIGAGPYLLGFLVPLTGYRGLYLIMTVVILATVVLYYYLHGKKASIA